MAAVFRSDANVSGDQWPHEDRRWPVVCERCGYVFLPGDAWQLFHEHLFRRDTGDVTTLQAAPVGAMWWAPWMAEHGDFYHSPQHLKRGGGPHLIVKTPGGDWDIDAKSSNGDGWQRSGEPPLIVARPSIGIPVLQGGGYGYHGFLGGSDGSRPGWLIEC